MESETLNSNTVITEHGLMYLNEDFDNNEVFNTNETLTTKLMLLKLAKIFWNEKIDDIKWVDIIDKVNIFVFLYSIIKYLFLFMDN